MPTYKYICKVCLQSFVYKKKMVDPTPECKICGADPDHLYQEWDSPPQTNIRGLPKDRFKGR